MYMLSQINLNRQEGNVRRKDGELPGVGPEVIEKAAHGMLQLIVVAITIPLVPVNSDNQNAVTHR